MLKVKNLVLFLMLALLISVSGVMAQEEPAGTIVDIAVGDENFSTLVELVTAAGLVDVLSGEGPYTVFAPTNEAFAALPAYVVEYLGTNPELLTRILTYHVVPGAVMSTDITEDMMATTAEMSTVGGEMMESQLTVNVTDEGIMVDGAMVVAADIVASNGVIHVIDAVLVPTIELPEVDPLSVTGDIITAGSSTVGPLSVAIVSQFTDEGYAGQASVDIAGTGTGFTRFCEAGETDVANASRPIRQEEADKCAALETPREPIAFTVATDALAVVVSEENDFATDLSTEEIAALFSTATNWSDVRPEWPAEPITRYTPGTASGTYDYFIDEIFDGDETLLQNAANVNQSEFDEQLVAGVSGNPFAIGFFGAAYYLANEDVLNEVSINGVAPTLENSMSGEYLLARPIFVYTSPNILTEKPQVAQFVSYYLQNAPEVSAEVGYYPAKPWEQNLSNLLILPFVSGESM